MTGIVHMSIFSIKRTHNQASKVVYDVIQHNQASKVVYDVIQHNQASLRRNKAINVGIPHIWLLKL